MKRILSIAIAVGWLSLSATMALASDRIIVATFSDSNKAYDAAKAVKDLKDAGGIDFKLKTGVIIAKDQNGNVSVLESRKSSSLWRGRRNRHRRPDWADRRCARCGGGGALGSNYWAWRRRCDRHARQRVDQLGPSEHSSGYDGNYSRGRRRQHPSDR